MSSWLRKMYNVFGSCNKWTRFWWALWDYLIITVFCVLICTREFTRVDLPKSSLFMLTSRNKPSYILWTFRQNFFSASWLQHNQHTIQINSVGIMLVMWIDVLFKYLKKIFLSWNKSLHHVWKEMWIWILCKCINTHLND